ncbi:hypothetical protein K227x_32340 [Rubripirellula lacrimiformis]|uniref:Uncharacterized protein n=1 Tax=Rubripirellula lacrimiformis TaxID=1930273 RepID=A0A517NCH2_9BACT|nr:hypothetical protein [Rubripirellula lacrimiformis]QDT04837.1 hypothetical protein K227x_32340 [Rubripirellula lacrimiformis]
MLSAAGIVLYQRTIGRDPIRRTNNSRWFDDGIGVVKRVYTGAWDSHDVVWGPGTHLILDQGSFDTRSTGGGSFRASLQMPKDPKVGDVIAFTPIPADRASVTFSSEYRETYTFMLPGEFTAFQFGNPLMDWMPSNTESSAELKILEMTTETVCLHITLHAVLPDFMDLDLNRDFTVTRNSTKTK